MAGLHSRVPTAPLDRFLRLVWTNERPAGLAHGREWGLPTGCAELVVVLGNEPSRRFASLDDQSGLCLPQGLLQGPGDRAHLRGTGGASLVVGAQFRPGGLNAFQREPVDACAGLTLPIEHWWPGFVDAVVTQLGDPARATPEARLRALEQALLKRCRYAPQIDPLVAWALPQWWAGASVGAVQAASGLAPATFIARYRASCGLAPKRHADVLRLQRLLRLARGLPFEASGGDGWPADSVQDRPGPLVRPSWAALAAQAGFADQAHLSRQFTRLTGMTPGHYWRHATEAVNHVAAR